MIYLTPYDQATRQPTGPSQPLPCQTLAEARAVLGEPSSERPAMLLYQQGPASLCVSRAVIAIDPIENSAYSDGDTKPTGSCNNA